MAVTEDSGYAIFIAIHVRNFVFILDPACSYHICHVKEFFNSYISSSGTVFMIYDQPYKNVGIQFVIQMLDGVVRSLINVRHIPSLCKNLILLGNLMLIN